MQISAKPSEKRSWFSRFLRSSSTNPPTAPRKAVPQEEKSLKHRRSVSEFAHNLIQKGREPQRLIDIQAMVRISGKSMLYLPHDFAPGSLVLPTCLRATAQFLSQHATTRGVFRIPGSVRIVNALFDYYCYVDGVSSDAPDVTNTVRCANLPTHIQSSVHDVASTFKRMLCAIPGGILGNLCMFDAFIAVHSHLQGDPEFPRTKQTKVRARLLALAIASIESQFRRELICAVFGLLSLIGRAAEVAPREDEEGRPLPTTDLMGYSALGIVFGPLLVGDLIDRYEMNLATPSTGLLVLPCTPKKQKERRKIASPEKVKPNPNPAPSSIDKIHCANSITEMLISNWRDIVRQMKSLGLLHRKDGQSQNMRYPSLRPSVSETYMLKKPRDWDQGRAESSIQVDRDYSPEPGTPTHRPRLRQPQSKKSLGSTGIHRKHSGMLSPHQEEGSLHSESAIPSRHSV